MKKVDVSIVGAGPGGSAAAIQLTRMGYNIVQYERERVGGLIHHANRIENYPAFPYPMKGYVFSGWLKMQTEAVGVTTVMKEVSEIEFQQDHFLTSTDDETVQSDYLVVATGTVPLIPESITPGERILTTPLAVQDESSAKCAIIGNGDAAFDYALNLDERGHQISINSRSGQVKCLQLLYNRANETSNIEIHYNRVLEKAQLEGENVVLKWMESGVGFTEVVDYLLIAIGRRADNILLKGSLEKHMDRLLNAKRLFLVGDVVNGIHRQAGIAVGDGLRAAMEIDQAIQNKLKQ